MCDECTELSLLLYYCSMVGPLLRCDLPHRAQVGCQEMDCKKYVGSGWHMTSRLMLFLTRDGIC
jgi:hypothetical protein